MTEERAGAPEDESFWANDRPATDDEALRLLRFGAVMNPMKAEHPVDQARTERRMLACAEYMERRFASSETGDKLDAERYRFLRTRIGHHEAETLSPAKYYYRRWYHDTTYKPDADTHAGMFDAAIDAGIKNAAPQESTESGPGRASSGTTSGPAVSGATPNGGDLRRKAFDDVLRVLRDRWLGFGFPGGGISDLDDINQETVNLCIKAVAKLRDSERPLP